MNLLQNTLFINLESREDRKFHVVHQLKQLGVENPQRFNAVKTASGAVGCSLSHIKCIELAKKNEWDYVAVIEDDFKCVNPEIFRSSLKKFQEKSENDGIQWDVLLLGGNNVPPYTVPAGVDYCVQITNVQSTVGYIVKKSFYDTMIANYREGVAQLMKNPTNKRQFAIDMYWKTLQSSGRWFMLTPLTITQCESYSDVEQRNTNYDHLMLDLDKKWLFEQAYMQQTLQNMTVIKNVNTPVIPQTQSQNNNFVFPFFK